MVLTYFAHNGVQHANAAAASTHESSSVTLQLFALSALVLCLAVGATYVLSTVKKPAAVQVTQKSFKKTWKHKEE